MRKFYYHQIAVFFLALSSTQLLGDDNAIKELSKVLRPYKLTPFSPPEQGWGPGGLVGKRHFFPYVEPYAAPKKLWDDDFDYTSIYKTNDVQLSNTDQSKTYGVSLTSDFLLDQIPLNFSSVNKYVKEIKITLTGTRYIRLLESDLISNRQFINTALLTTRAPLSGRPLWIPLKTLMVDSLDVSVTIKPDYSATVSSANLFESLGIKEGEEGKDQAFAFTYKATNNYTMKFDRTSTQSAVAVAWGEALPLTEKNIAILKGTATSVSFPDRPEAFLEIE